MRFSLKSGGALFGALLAITISVACSGDKMNCVDTPTGPSCVKGKVDANNRPAGPGEGVRATASFAVYTEDCSANWQSCANELPPTGNPAHMVPDTDRTYVLPGWANIHTAVICVEHPRVAGRKVSLQLSAGTAAGTSLMFDEAEPSRQGDPAAPRAKVCLALAFNMTLPSGIINQVSGRASMTEGGQDLFTSTTWVQRLGFKVVR